MKFKKIDRPVEMKSQLQDKDYEVIFLEATSQISFKCIFHAKI